MVNQYLTKKNEVKSGGTGYLYHKFYIWLKWFRVILSNATLLPILKGNDDF